ncbi:MAG: TetR/AcrR family transcriptional regulator [Candidatus Nanopelagicales bacterium]
MARMTADERRESVLRAAAPEFALGGLAGTSTESIARRAGVSQPYLFRLFPTKKALFLASAERTFARVEQAFRDAADGRTGREALDAMALAYAGLLQDRDLLLHQLQAYAACDDPEVRDVTRAAYGRLWLMVQETTGVPEDEVRSFFAMGMLMNVIAAMDLDHLDAPWAQACLPPPVPPRTT